MDTKIIDKEIELLFNQSLEDPQIIRPYFVRGNTNLVAEVQTYTSLEGNGFRVVGKLKKNNKTYIRVKNYGPDTQSEMTWQELCIPYFQILNLNT
jgi:hypothetical protein